MCIPQLSWCRAALSVRPMLSSVVFKLLCDLLSVALFLILWKICLPQSKWCLDSKVNVIKILPSQKGQAMCLTKVIKWNFDICQICQRQRERVFSRSWAVDQASSVRHWILCILGMGGCSSVAFSLEPGACTFVAWPMIYILQYLFYQVRFSVTQKLSLTIGPSK
jgi:hypothetical protein